MWAALTQQFGVCVADGSRRFLAPRGCADLTGVTLGGDGCETNVKLWKHIICQSLSEEADDGADGEEADDDADGEEADDGADAAGGAAADAPTQVVVAKSCIQHAIALVKAPCARILDINVPVFCIAKQFTLSSHSKVSEEAAYEFVDARLRWVQAQLLDKQCA